MKYPNHTIRLRNGELFSFKRRFRKKYTSLLRELKAVCDGRSNQGKRHNLDLILLILFCGITAGHTTIEDCVLWAMHNYRFLKRYIPLTHGIPVATTISRALAVCDVDSLVEAFTSWKQILFNEDAAGKTASFDGKAMRAVHGEDMVRHILSLFIHEDSQVIGQAGVTTKENEIPAAQRLLEQITITDMLLLADALHTQKKTAETIVSGGGDYLLIVKENQRQLLANIILCFTDDTYRKEAHCATEHTRGRSITTRVTLIKDKEVNTYLSPEWKSVACVGRVHRQGTRDNGAKHIDETVYFICSRKGITAQQAAIAIRHHWYIENKLHWVKDVIFLEDRQTLRKGVAPQVMTYLRSMCISLCALFDFASIGRTLKNFQMNTMLHHRFLTVAAVV
jgi:predicted transposase YbfD/YdcC